MVTHQGETPAGELHPNLVGSTCFQFAFHYGDIAQSFDDAVVGDSVFTRTSVREYFEALAVVGVAAYVTDNGAAIFFDIPPNNSNVFAVDRVVEELFCQF